ncbi:DUF3592 domain-containing protein [Streptomyces sp. NPDC102360]|uniref:DUF3592 domain-containing protein n=1 Tax=Streptomyces sp. NPDC102360 TaxID=3366160 RepID=UPI0037F7E13A
MAFGAVFAIAGAGSLYKTRRLRRNGVRTTGTVIRLDASSGGDGTSYHPVVRYRACDGRLVESRSSLGKGRSSSLHPGTPVTVFYDRAKPRRMAIDGYAGASMFLFAVFGAVVIAGGAFLLGRA